MQERAGRAVFRKVLLFGALAAGMVLLLDVGCIFRRVTGIPCPGCGMTRAHLAAVMALDKKAEGDGVRCVLLTKIGACTGTVIRGAQLEALL